MKMPYANIMIVFDALHLAFYPDGIPDDEDTMDERVESLFVLFLNTVGWTSEEFWNTFERINDLENSKTIEDSDIAEDDLMDQPKLSSDKKFNLN